VENANVKAAANIALNKLAATTVSRALVSDGSGFVSASAVTATEIGYLDGVTSAIQTQLIAKAPIASPTFTTGATSPAFITGNSGTLKLVDGDGDHFTTIAAHATTAADVAYTWPDNAPGTSGYALTSTTGGVMSWAAAGGPTEATQAVLEEDTPGSNTANTYISPEVAHFHPGVAKAWVKYEQDGASHDGTDYGVDSLADNGVGQTTITWTTAFSSANYAVVGSSVNGEVIDFLESSIAAGSIDARTRGMSDNSAVDNSNNWVVAYGEVV
jgi:hypothetical protein